MGWKKHFLELMVQQTAAIERLCTMQHVMIEHMQHLLMLQDVMPQKLILPDTFTHPLFHAFEEIDISTIPACPEGDRPGHVYLLVAENAWSKIGMSRNMKVRVKQLKIQFPFRTKLVHVIPTDDVVDAEKMLHNVFEDCRLVPGSHIIDNKGKKSEARFGYSRPMTAIGTEWFRLSVQAVEWIKMIPHMISIKEEASHGTAGDSTTISEPPLGDIDDRIAYLYSHYGWNNFKRRRIELLDEYDVDKFWAQFVAPPPRQETEPAPSVQSEETLSPEVSRYPVIKSQRNLPMRLNTTPQG
jgi:Meiotically up-regulated gene 113